MVSNLSGHVAVPGIEVEVVSLRRRLSCELLSLSLLMGHPAVQSCGCGDFPRLLVIPAQSWGSRTAVQVECMNKLRKNVLRSSFRRSMYM